MTTHEPRSCDRSLHYYTMKTSRPAVSTASGHTHSRSPSHTSPQSYRPSKSTTPLTSPRMPHSVGQPYPPPRPSPGTAASRVSGPAQDVRTASPNYFGLVVEPTSDPRDSAVLPRTNWSPPSSSVKSFAAAITQHVPLEANPEFEAFRRQADANRGFALSSAQLGRIAPGTPQLVPAASLSALAGPLPRPRPPRWHTHGSDSASEASISRSSGPAAAGKSRGHAAGRMDADADSSSTHDSAYVSADSKRNSEASLSQQPWFLNLPRHESPAQLESPFEPRTSVSNVEDRHPRLSVMQGRAEPPPAEPGAARGVRADTVPARLESGSPAMMSPAQLRDILESPSKEEDLLLLDVRAATQYSASRIQGALNLCIPTTLLKRASFNLLKLQGTFQNGEQREAFAAWRDKRYLVVYDAGSAEKRDAVAAMNMLKKFTSEGYGGQASVLRGGHNHFAALYPHLIDHRAARELSGSPPLSLGGGGGGGADVPRPSAIPPVIGGVSLPGASSNPFFSNIRQNMDLADGVGQMDLTLPPNLDVTVLPRWLRAAADAADRGKAVSDKFLAIELAEQARMKKAYTVVRPAAADDGMRQQADHVRLSGIEKGGKNRYKDILPFEHARVVLEGRPEGACDYVNASHIKATGSHKRYIASQGPLPATFEDFWSMVWDQDVRVVVMLTAESEGGQLKCHPYWTGKDFGPIKLRSLSEKKVSLDIDKHRSQSAMSGTSSGSSATPFHGSGSSAGETGRKRANTTTLDGSLPTPAQARAGPGVHGEIPYVIIRKFALSHNAHPFAPIREITHLHYPSWPDFGATAQPSHLLALVELANVMQRAALPLDVPSTLASAPPEPSPLPGSTSSPSTAGSRSRADPVSLSWFDEPESDAAARPMLVHCSAGCGRTGTFCTVDTVIDMLKRQRMLALKKANAKIEARERQLREARKLEVDRDGDVAMDNEVPSPHAVVYGTGAESFDEATPSQPPLPRSTPPLAAQDNSSDETLRSDGGDTAAAGGLKTDWLDDDGVDLVARAVEDFRTQRLSMVQSLRQFVLCYETIIEWVWRLQERAGTRAHGRSRRARSGSLQTKRTD